MEKDKDYHYYNIINKTEWGSTKGEANIIIKTGNAGLGAEQRIFDKI
jgi:hypothetical protein